MKTKLPLISESAANPFLAGDGLLNLTKLAQLRSKIQKEVKKATLFDKRGVFNIPGLSVTNARKIVNDFGETVEVVKKPAKSPTGTTFQVKAKPSELKKINQQLLDVAEPKPTHVHSINAKAKTAKYSAAQAKKSGNFLYMSRRAVRIAQRRSVTSTATLMLPVYGKGLLSKATEALMRKAESAIKSHVKKAERVREKVSADRAKVSQERTTAFENAVPALTEMVVSLGVRESNIVVSSGMGGRSMLAKLKDGTIIRVALADDKQFRDARKAAREAAAE